MKKFLYILLHCAVIFAVGAMVACEDAPVNNEEKPNDKPEPEPTPEVVAELSAEISKVSTSSATAKVTTKNLASVAYLLETKDADFAADIVYATGTTVECKDGVNTLSLQSLKPNTNYVLVIAGATVAEEFYEDVVKVNFTTEGFTEELTFFDIDYMSVSAHFNYPHDKVQKDNVLKWGICEFPIYYENIAGQSDADMINRHDTAWGPHIYFTDSKTWVFNELESYLDQDPNAEDAAALYSPIVPGQPMYLMIGEFTMDRTDHWGWGDGYYKPLFDSKKYWADVNATGRYPDQNDYWSGFYRRDFFQSKEPSKMSAKPEVKMDLTPIGGKVTITPPAGVHSYCFGVMDSGTYMQLLSLLNNKAEYVQWYITSFHAFASGIALAASGEVTFELSDLYNLEHNTNYTLYITSLGDAQGSKQSFAKFPFTMPNPTEAPAKIEVKGISNPEGADRHDQVWFNVKCTEGTIIDAKMLANYERDWASLINQYKKSGYTEDEAWEIAVDTYGLPLDETEIAAMKTAEGYSFWYSSRADATTVCAVRTRNSQGVVTVAHGSMRSIKEPAATPVNSTLFEDLKGEWTASTTISYKHYHFRENPPAGVDNNYQLVVEEPISCKVTIGEIGYEKTLPESVYDLFFKASNLKTKEEVDAVYQQFKTTVDDFNTHVRNQNRILLQGFDLEYDVDLLPCSNPEHTDKPDGKVYTKYASPYDLFIADEKTYSAYNYESPVFDFGPKWYLEIAADGSVYAPFNPDYFSPMSQWYQNVYQFMGINYRSEGGKEATDYKVYTLPNFNGQMGYFPVTISEDKNTITIHPVQLTYTAQDDNGVNHQYTDNFYPNIVRESASIAGVGYQVYSRIIAPIVLTRGYKAPAATTATPASASTKSVGKVVETLSEPLYKVAPKKGVFRSRTALPIGAEISIPKKVDYSVISTEQFKANSKRLADERFGRK